MDDLGRNPIRLRGVRVHNLKGIDLDLPIGRLIVFSGVSGSGKSSLAYDTLYAEGQRRYVETFSAYARQFLERLDKPDADTIDGLPPAIAVGQKGGRRSARSTVGSATEIHDHLAILFARASKLTCSRCGANVQPADPAKVSAGIEALDDRTRYLVAFPMEIRPESDRQALADGLREDGFTRVRVDGQMISIDENQPLPGSSTGEIDVIVDRLIRGSDPVNRRLDSIEIAFQKGLGRCRIITDDAEMTYYRGWRCARCGADYPHPEPRLFSPNSPLGACPTCEGFGRVIALDLDRIIPDPTRSLREGAIVPWTMPSHLGRNAELIRLAPRLGIPVDRPFSELSAEQVRLIVEGGPEFPGLRGFFDSLERKSYKMHVRVFLSRWRGYRPCQACGGSRLRPEALAFQVGGFDIAAFARMPISEARIRLDSVLDGDEQAAIAIRVLDPVLKRLGYLDRIGLGYLSLDRPMRTLSGGESRRVGLTGALGSGLVNTLYVLDEPTIGLHPRDVGRLVEAMSALRDSGNSVVVVEHDPIVMRAADRLVDFGPGAGLDGGQIVYDGTPSGIESVDESATGAYLSGRSRLEIPRERRKPNKGFLRLGGASGHNLKNIDLEIPLGLFCVVSGVSGSGKSTLIEETLYPALARKLRAEAVPGEPFQSIEGYEPLADVALIDQTPIGRSGRSNPVTYVGAFDEIRKTFAATGEAKIRNYSAGRFSFNVEGGRCNACEGNGFQTIDMQFLADVMIRCPECKGTRYRAETLEVTYRGKNIAEVLDLTVREAFGFFRHRPKVQSRLRPLMDVGLDYLRLGQPATTLSGGEAQRLKLAEFLVSTPSAMTQASGRKPTLFLLDEPTTGLHPADTARLLDGLNRLVDLGHSLILVEHELDVMMAADWIIDLGPEAGSEGGRIVAKGTPEDVALSQGHTGKVLEGAISKTVSGGFTSNESVNPPASAKA